jgi:hypothetical protein
MAASAGRLAEHYTSFRMTPVYRRMELALVQAEPGTAVDQDQSVN